MLARAVGSWFKEHHHKKSSGAESGEMGEAANEQSADQGAIESNETASAAGAQEGTLEETVKTESLDAFPNLPSEKMCLDATFALFLHHPSFDDWKVVNLASFLCEPNEIFLTQNNFFSSCVS